MPTFYATAYGTRVIPDVKWVKTFEVFKNDKSIGIFNAPQKPGECLCRVCDATTHVMVRPGCKQSNQHVE